VAQFQFFGCRPAATVDLATDEEKRAEAEVDDGKNPAAVAALGHPWWKERRSSQGEETLCQTTKEIARKAAESRWKGR